ncbi:MAG: protein-L-isoaspartate(D-aspartate) O-methyltransferase [Actinobacteria bacterium]|nr:protein-L-isoaspartate(D-aspartate) O-methyltransferase [Actinomycetota bacterium]
MDYKEARERMVNDQIIGRGIKDKCVIEAMLEIPRHLFVLYADRDLAYGDYPLSIGEGQTISQPYMVAWMTEILSLKGEEKVLEIGTGSGYQGAILAKLSKEVYTIERHKVLAERVEKIYDELGIKNIKVIIGDGTEGLSLYAPYDRIIVTAGTPKIPPPLIEQLGDGGRLVAPIGTSYLQMLILLEKNGEKTKITELGSCVFVPLVGKFGWKE